MTITLLRSKPARRSRRERAPHGRRFNVPRSRRRPRASTVGRQEYRGVRHRSDKKPRARSLLIYTQSINTPLRNAARTRPADSESSTPSGRSRRRRQPTRARRIQCSCRGSPIGEIIPPGASSSPDMHLAVRSRCRRFHLTDDDAEDACQWIWVGLLDRLLSFRYDPNGSFHAWLRRYCDSRLIDRHRGRATVREIPIDEAFGPDGPLNPAGAAAPPEDGPLAAGRSRLLSLAAQIHGRVRAQVGCDRSGATSFSPFPRVFARDPA